ncbi:TIGR02302 family protein [Caenispirillum bisanense]|uniref:TIGR02302 family protein n=1 Tax=Caenispirillum bisanense TaxID=414052 RepID=A0A286GI54_9PROT|nr:TIGR02302 family protein [Caenispirillum bisanense]SOD94799.1 TIGR02302 family protein [Caenispirillum bisanense]
MTKPAAPSPRPPLAGRLLLARWSLLTERLWERLWPAATLVLLFLGLAFLDVLPRLPGWLHLGLLAALGLGAAGALAVALFRFPWPTPDEARTLLETRGAPGDTRLPYHRPLTALMDQPARPADDAFAAGLWQAHRERMLAAARRLSVPAPAPHMATRDPLGVRAVGVLTVVVGLAVGWGDLGQRLARAVTPTLPQGATLPLTADVWITPPAYTGRPPVTLTAGRESATAAGGVAAPQALGPVRVPEGSALVALVHGAAAPVLTAGGAPVPLEQIGDGSHRLETTLDTGSRLVIEDDGRTVADWPVAVTADMPPTVRFTGAPDEASRWRLRLPYAAGDDYGIQQFVLQVARPDRPDTPTLEVALDPPAPSPADNELVEREGAAAVDLTPHPWAGLPVTVRLKATDGAGQTALSDLIDTVLPERRFQHPVAAAIAAVRKEVARDPSTAPGASAVLDRLHQEVDAYDGDPVVYLGLRIAANRLYHEKGAAVDPVLGLLWELAVRLEDGGLTMASRDLEAAEEALREALENDASDAEVERLLNELQQALDRFSEMLAQMMQQMPQMPMMGQLPQDMQMIDPSQMREMLERMREMNELGSREAAKAMLDELSRMMEAMRNMQPMSPDQMQQMQQAQEMMRELQKLAREQEQMLEQSFAESQQQQRQGGQPNPGQQGQQGQQGQSGSQGQGGSGQSMAQAQEDLRMRLGDLMRRLGEMAGQVPDNLGQAEMAMRGAAEALQGDRFGSAADAQGQALEAMRQGMGQAMQQMMQAMGMPGMMPMPMPTMGAAPGRDPLGRRGGVDPGTTKVPTEPEEKRARELLEELRRRAGDRDRPAPELDYLHRLLRQF